MEPENKLLKQQKALDESIKIWKSYTDMKLFGSINCPCCDMAPNDCIGCPIYEYKGVKSCLNTPYYDARYAYFKALRNKDEQLTKNYLQKVQEEINFLNRVRRSLNHVSKQ